MARAVAGTTHGELWSARILVRRADELAIDVQSRRPNGIRKLRSQPLHLLAIEQIDVRKTAEPTRVDREEEAARFDLNVFDRTLDLLLRAFADGKDVVLGDVALLLRKNRGEAHRADLATGLNAVVARGNAGGQKARWRWLKGDIAHFESLQRFVSFPLIKD